MPFFYDPNLQKDEEEQQGLASGAAPVKLAGGSSTNEQGAPDAGGSQGKKGLNTGSGFQNLENYLKTNDAQKFGGQVVGNVEKTIDTAKQNQTDAAQGFKTKVDSLNQTPDRAQIDQAIADPSKTNASQFKDWRTQGFKGAGSLAEDQENWNKYWSGANQAASTTKQLGSEGGRFALLDQYFGRPQYNYGEKSLDNLLVQQSGALDKSQDLQNQAAKLKSQGAGTAKELQNYATARAGEVNQSRDYAQQALSGAQSQVRGDVDRALQDANVKRAMEFDRFKRELASGQLSADQLSVLGIGNESLYGLDPTSYLSQGANLERNQVMTGDQQARLKALSELAGEADPYLEKNIEGQTPLYAFDRDRFLSDRGAAQSKYQQELSELEKFYAGQVKNIQQPMNQGRTTTITGGDGSRLQDQGIINQYNAQLEQARRDLARKYNIQSTGSDPLIAGSVQRSPSYRTR